MKRTTAVCLLTTTLMLCSGPLLADEVVRSEEADVRVTQVAATADVVMGTVENHSNLLVRNPRLLIQHAWIWADEHNPGTDNPGRSEIVTIPAEIPPGGSFVFSHRLPRGPIGDQRGRFTTNAEVVGFEQVGRVENSSLR